MFGNQLRISFVLQFILIFLRRSKWIWAKKNDGWRSKGEL